MADKEVKLYKELRTIISLVRVLHEGNDVGRDAEAYKGYRCSQRLDPNRPGTWYSIFRPFDMKGLKYMGRDGDWIYFVRVEVNVIHH